MPISDSEMSKIDAKNGKNVIIVDISIILKGYVGFLRRSMFRGVPGNKKLVLGKMGNLGDIFECF